MFQFKQFAIHQDKCGMKISSSACMLGSLVEIRQSDKYIIDIGTGTGLLALMLAQRSSTYIDAIEIEQEAAIQAAQNFELSPWSNRLQLFQADVTKWAFEREKKYDLIVCNPPFFRAATLSTNEKRRLARHEHQLDVPILADMFIHLLAENGAVWLLISADSYAHYLQVLGEKGLFLFREIALWDNPAARKNFCYILAFSQENKERLSEKKYFRTAPNGDFSPEYIAAMRDFLIIFP